MNKIKELPIDERPYEKCFNYGPSTLTDAELVGIILRTGTKGLNAYDLARKILDSNNSNLGIVSLMHLTKEELLNIKGVGKVKAVQLLCLSELAKRISRTNASFDLNLSSPSSIADYFMEDMRHLEQEELLVLFLDTKCNLISKKTMTKGTVNKSLMPNREIISTALRINAVGIILLHNHPSGDPTPSKADIESTIKLRQACNLVDLVLLDHIVIGDIKYVSFAESNINFWEVKYAVKCFWNRFWN